MTAAMKHRRRPVLRTSAGRQGVLALAVAAALSAPCTALAQSASPGDRRAAGAAYDQGMGARAAGENARAANFFETADRLAPSPQALGNAIRSHRDAHEPAQDARAATLALRMRARYGGNERFTAFADEVIAALSPTLTRVQVSCEQCEIEIDHAVSSDREFFLEPGSHELVGHFSEDRLRQRTISAIAGNTETIVLSPPIERPGAGTGPETDPAAQPPVGTAPEPSHEPGPALTPGAPAEPAGPVATPPEAPPARDTGAHGRGVFPPGVFVTSVIVTAGLGGVLVWSGLNTLDGVPDYRANPTPERLAEGQGRELRTNVLIGATAAVGAFTVASLILTRWGSPVAVSPVVSHAGGNDPGLTLGGRF